ncbi:SDR family oxidoreductase shroud isoform X2 [Rhodnius prolixus]
MTVFSCVLNENSQGADDLKLRENTYVLRLDVTDRESINNLQTKVNKIVTAQEYDFLGIVNNSGVMVFGEYEWLTENQIDNQINVNFRGTIHVTKAFLPLIRKYKGRVINVTSHCSVVPLPTLSVYAGTKAAVDAWSSALRIELEKFDVKVITLTPGSYVTQSNIMSRQIEYKENMKKEMLLEAQDVYNEYFNRFHDYLSTIPCQKELVYIQDNNLMSKFDKALLSNKPAISYVNSPTRYKFFHFIIRFAPTVYLRHFFIRMYMNFPKW